VLKFPAMRVGVLALTSFFLVFLFAVRPMRLIAPLTTYGQTSLIPTDARNAGPHQS
jgi:hypothetical protein